jgi:hypothetical protein
MNVLYLNYRYQNGPKRANSEEPFCALGEALLLLVRERGLEPPRLAALVPQTSVSAIPPLARVGAVTELHYHI